MKLCPTCGGEITQWQDITIPRPGVVSRGNQTVRLTNSQYKIFQCLLAARGKFVTKMDLYGELYWNSTKEPGSNIIGVLVCYMRKALGPLGIEVCGLAGAGWCLRLVDHATAPT